MHAISMGLYSAVPILLSVQTSVVLTSLSNGVARPGDTLGVSLSNGVSISSYAWGSSPGGAEYGTGSTLLVPSAADGSLLHVTLTADGQQFTSVAEIRSDPVAVTTLVPGSEEILVQSLTDMPTLPALTLSADADAILVETL